MNNETATVSWLTAHRLALNGMADKLTLNRCGQFVISPSLTENVRQEMWARHPEIAAVFAVNHGESDECQCGGDCDECKAKLAANCGGKGSGRPGPCPKHPSQAHLVARAHAAAAAHALAAAATAHSRSGTAKTEAALEKAHNDYIAKMKEAKDADFEKRKQGHLDGENPKGKKGGASPKAKVGKSPADVIKPEPKAKVKKVAKETAASVADEPAKVSKGLAGTAAPTHDPLTKDDHTSAKDLAAKSAATDRVHDDFVGHVARQYLADHGFTDAKGQDIYKEISDRAIVKQSRPGDDSLAKHIDSETREKLRHPDEPTQRWLAEKLPKLADAHAATAEGRGITKPHEFVKYARSKPTGNSSMQQNEKVSLWRRIGRMLGLTGNQFQITPPQDGNGPDRSPAGQFAPSGGGGYGGSGGPSKFTPEEDEASERGESTDELRKDTRGSGEDKRGGVEKDKGTHNSNEYDSRLSTNTLMTVSNPKMTVSNPKMTVTPQMTSPPPTPLMSVNERECPKCGGPLDDDGDCEDCGHHVENSNPEGHNQYSKGGGGVFGKIQTSSADASRASNKLPEGERPEHSRQAVKAAADEDHDEASKLHGQAAAFHEAKAEEWFNPYKQAHEYAAALHHQAAVAHGGHSVSQLFNAGVHQTKHGDTGRWQPHGSGTGKGPIHAAAVGGHGDLTRVTKLDEPGVEADEEDDSTSEAIAEGDQDMRTDGAGGEKIDGTDPDAKAKLTNKDALHPFRSTENQWDVLSQVATNRASEGDDMIIDNEFESDSQRIGFFSGGPGGSSEHGVSKGAEGASRKANKSGLKKDHKAAAKEHKAAAAKHGALADEARSSGDKGKAKQHDIMAEHHKDAASKHGNFTRNTMTGTTARSILSANCSCETDRVAMNALSDAAAIRLVANAPFGGGDDDDDDDDDEDMENNKGEDVHSFDMKKPMKADSLQAGGEGEKDEYMTGNRSTVAWLRKMGAPSSVVNTVMNAERKETAERKAKVGRLVENIGNAGLRNRIGNKLMSGAALSIDETAVLANASARQYAPPPRGEDQGTNYLGAGEARFVDNSAPLDDTLDCPVLNFKEIAAEQRQQRA